MSLAIAAAITRMVEHGIPIDEASKLVAAVYTDGVRSAPYRTEVPGRTTAAERQARYRDKKRNENVTRDVTPVTPIEPIDSVTRDVTTVTSDVTRDANANVPLSIEDKRVKEDKREAHSRRGSRLPAGWLPADDDASFAMSLGYTAVLYDREVLKFRNHFDSAPGKAGVKLDWHKTFRNWLIRGAERLCPPRQLSVVPTTATSNAVFVVRGSEQWKAWTEARGREPFVINDGGREGQWMRTEWPTKEQVA